MSRLRLTIIMFILAAALAPVALVGFGLSQPTRVQEPAPGGEAIEPGVFAPAGLKQAPWEGATKPASPAPAGMPPARATEPEVAGAEATALVELFTSEGCSSCPPADRLLSEIAAPGPASRRVICVAYHVDYWDHLGWKDPFASASHTALQQTYAGTLGDSGVYTPQAVINGRTGFVGSDRGRLTEEIDRAMVASATARLTAVLDGPFKAGRSVGVTVRVKAVGPSGLPADVRIVAAITENGLTSTVTSGENKGRELSHDAVCRLRVEGKADAAGRATIELPVPAGVRPDRARVAVWAEDGASRVVIAATYAAPALR